MTKNKMWTALGGVLAMTLAQLPVADLPMWASLLVTAGLGALTALGVYRVPNKEIHEPPVAPKYVGPESDRWGD
jgi:hypothetical protein